MEDETLTHEDCIDGRHEGECAGDVFYFPRYDTYGLEPELAYKCFPRCEKHYEEYVEKCEARLQRRYEAERRNYCKHGTFIGDPYGPDYLCGRCEAGD